MRITVCELPHEPAQLDTAWPALCQHVRGESSELVLLPEFAFVPPVWNSERFDAAVWSAAERTTAAWIERLDELGAEHVVGARPVTVEGRAFNEGFHWTAGHGATRLRRKYWLPDEPGGWEARWFERGDAEFGVFSAGGLRFALNICTELWALDTYARYAEAGIDAILSPRATAAATTQKWLAIGTVAAVRSGAYSVSSNRVHRDASCGGVGWIIGPDGQQLAATSAQIPFRTLDVDPGVADRARSSYPRYVFARGR